MRIFKLSILALLLGGAGLVACGSNGGNHDSAVIPLPGTGGAVGLDAGGMGGAGGTQPYDAPIALDAADAPVQPQFDLLPSEGGVSKSFDSAGGEVGPNPCFDCTGLTPQQCHDQLIGSTTCPLDPSIVTPDPGPDPVVPYPTCAAI